MTNQKPEDIQKKVAIYLRVSSEDQVEKYGLQMQEEAIKGLIKSKGQFNDGTDKYVLAGNSYIYKDEDVSGTVKLQERPNFARLIEDILLAPEGKKPFDVVAVYRIDRLARRLTYLLDCIELLENYKIDLISANESIDTTTPFGKAILSIVGVIAELELETIKERTKGGRKEAYKVGVVMGACAEFGYKKDAEKKREIFDNEANIVREIFHYFVYERRTAQEIADIFIENKYITPDVSSIKYGKRKGTTKKKHKLSFWRSETIKEILKNEVYIGNYYHHKTKNKKNLPKSEWKLSPHRHDPIIESATFKIAQDRLAKISNKSDLSSKRRKQHTFYPLSGLLKCNHCKNISPDEKMTNWIGGRKKISSDPIKHTRFYACGRKNRKKYPQICPTLPIPAQTLENYIFDFLIQLIKSPKATYEHQMKLKSNQLRVDILKKNKKDLTKLQNELPQRIKRLKEQHELSYIDTDELKKKIKRIREREIKSKQKIEELTFEINQQSVSMGYIKAFDVFNDKYSKAIDEISKDKEKMAEIAHFLIDDIVVYSRSVTDEDKVAGRKKQDQQIPYSISIVLRLPIEILYDVVTSKEFRDKPKPQTKQFGVKNGNW